MVNNAGTQNVQRRMIAAASVPAPPSPTGPFRKAVKHDAKLRLAISGPSGSGKTYTLLTIAAALGGPFAVVDTEHGSASKYADIFEFGVLELNSYDPEHLIKIIDQAAEAGFRVLCIDSLSHFWMGKDGELEKVDRAARRMQNPNGFAAWKQVTPIHNALIDKIIGAPLHVLASMRTKTEWILDHDERTGKTVPRKVGLAPVMRDGIEYEFDVCGEMDQENTLQVTKSRCPKLAGGVFPKPGKEFAEILQEWLCGLPWDRVEPKPPERATDAHVGGQNGEVKVNETSPAAIPEELTSIWKRMCSPRGVAKEFGELRVEIEQLAGVPGLAEYARILRAHGVERPKDFKTSQTARLCAKEVFTLLEELRSNARENTEPLEVEPEVELPSAAQRSDASEAK